MLHKYCMAQDFWGWLQQQNQLNEARQPFVSPTVLQGYENEFRRQLDNLIQRTDDPQLRQQFEKMRDCPITDRQGRCRDFSEYIVSTLVRQGVHHRYDVEAALGYVLEKMFLDKSVTTSQPRATLFGGFDEKRPYQPGENPLQARFLTFLSNAVRNITAGRIPRLSNIQKRPAGTLSIGAGRADKESGFASPDEIAAPSSSQRGLDELLGDIRGLLSRQEGQYDLPLVDLFNDMMAGMRTAEQRRKYGDRATKFSRELILQTIERYARATDNHALLKLLRRFEDYNPAKPMEPPRQVQKIKEPKLPPKQKDFASIIQVIEKLGRPVGTADLGKYRRRWLDYAPRDPHSPYKNRLDATLAAMVDEGVLVRTPTGRGGYLYSPGPNFEQYRKPVAA